MGYFLTKISLMLRVLFRWKLQTIEDKFHKHVDGRHPKFLFRLLFGWAFSSQRLYRLWHAVPKAIAENIFFIQDFYIPFEQAHSALQHLMQAIGLCPVWLCPVKGTKTPQFLSPHYGAPLYVNLGFYGIPGSPHPIPRLTAQVERDILSFGGRKMLYSLTYYSKEDFSKIYDSEHYTELRKKFYAEEAFLPLYKKVTNML